MISLLLMCIYTVNGIEHLLIYLNFFLIHCQFILLSVRLAVGKVTFHCLKLKGFVTT